MTFSIKKNGDNAFYILLAATVISFFMGWISLGWFVVSFLVLAYFKEDLFANLLKKVGPVINFILLLAIVIFALFNDWTSSGWAVICIVVLSFLGVITALISCFRRNSTS